MFRKMKKKVEKCPLYWKVEKAMLLAAVAIQCAMTPITSYAIKDTKLVTGTEKLINDVTAVLLVLEVVVVIALEIWMGIKWQAAAEIEEKTKHVKAMKGTLIAGILIMTISGLIPVVFAYYA